ncbi:Protein pianissimo A [Diplonema papillatum]|nr:Protein pianissimo A [Diplonema papillatum]
MAAPIQEIDCSLEAVSKKLRVLDSRSASADERVRALEQLALIGKARTTSLADPVPLIKCLRRLLVSKNLWTRCASLRVVKCFLHDHIFTTCAWELCLDWFISRSMDRNVERDKKLEKERDLSFRVVQRCIAMLMQDHISAKEGTERGFVNSSGSFGEKRDAARLTTPGHFAGVGSALSAGSALSSTNTPRCTSTPPFVDAVTSDPHLSTPTHEQQAPESRHPKLPRGIIQRLQSTAENADDPFQRRALKMLRDLLITSPSSVSNANAVRTLTASLTDPDLCDFHASILSALLYTLDDPSSRAYLRVHLDLQPLFGPFTEKVNAKPENQTELKKRLACSKENLLALFRSWVGLFYVASDTRCLRPLVDSLRMPGPAFRKMAIFEVLHIAIRTAAPLRGIPRSGPWIEYLDEDERDAILRDEEKARTARSSDATTVEESRRQAAGTACAGHSSLDIFLGAMLLILEKAGLTETLISLIRMGMGIVGERPVAGDDKNSDALVSQAAAHLLQMTLNLSSSLFPDSSSHKLYVNFDRTIADMLAGKDCLVGMHATAKVRTLTNALFRKVVYAEVPRKPIRLDSIKLQMSSNMDDTQFRILLNDSQVTTTKDWNKWNCETALFLIKGPLRLHSRLQETLKTKFFKRLLTFIKPRRRLFSELPYREENLIYSTLACGLVELLLQSKEGLAYLSNSGLLDEIRSILNEVTANVQEREKILCRERIMYFMAREYFKIIGKCSESAFGIELLTKHQIFKSLQHLMEKSKLKDRDDVSHQILKHLHFGSVGSHEANAEARQIFANAMADGSRPIRLFATLQLKSSFRLGYNDGVDWALTLLVAQLSDSWREVAKAAHEIINEWCMIDDDVLDAFIHKRPGMQIFTRREDKVPEETINKLLLRMLTREAGFAYLYELGVVQKQLEQWRTTSAIDWVSTLETNIASVMVPARPDVRSQHNRKRARVDTITSSIVFPPHFFGEIANTGQGAEYLRESTVLDEYAATINRSILDDEPDSCWIPSHLSQSSETGRQSFSLAENSRFLRVAEKKSMRGSVSMYYDDEGEIPDIGDQQPESPQRNLTPRTTRSVDIATADYTPKAASAGAMKVRNSVQLRAALWAIAHVASSEPGFSLLQSQGLSDLIGKMVKMATQADHISLRGSLMCMLSVVGRSQSGKEALAKFGWVTNECNGYSTAEGVWFASCFAYPTNYDKWIAVHNPGLLATPCIPVYDAPDLEQRRLSAEKLFASLGVTTKTAPDKVRELDVMTVRLVQQGACCSVTDAKREFSVLLACHHREYSPSTSDSNAYDVVLDTVRTLSNPVLVDGSGKTLKKVRQQDATIFHDAFLSLEIHELLNTYRFRAMTRKSLYDTYLDQTVFTHDAFAYLDAKMLVFQSITPTLMNEAHHNTSHSGRSSPAIGYVSPLSKGPERPGSEGRKVLVDLIETLKSKGDAGRGLLPDLVQAALQSPESAAVWQVLTQEKYSRFSTDYAYAALSEAESGQLASELQRLCTNGG